MDDIVKDTVSHFGVWDLTVWTLNVLKSMNWEDVPRDAGSVMCLCRAMFKHSELWRAIDRLAELHGLSTSGLARKSGLDPTTFNKSKRITATEKPRWPSTESLAKILNATGSSMRDFLTLLEEGGEDAKASCDRIPLSKLDPSGGGPEFGITGYPVGSGWSDVEFPGLSDPRMFALEVVGDSLLPLYREGSLIIVSPETRVRIGDRVLMGTASGGLGVYTVAGQTMTHIKVAALENHSHVRALDSVDVAWISRIVWASQ